MPQALAHPGASAFVRAAVFGLVLVKAPLDAVVYRRDREQGKPQMETGAGVPAPVMHQS